MQVHILSFSLGNIVSQVDFGASQFLFQFSFFLLEAQLFFFVFHPLYVSSTSFNIGSNILQILSAIVFEERVSSPSIIITLGLFLNCFRKI